MPWETGSGEGKYQYYPGGDRSAAPKDAPSAVNVVVVPDVNLPKVRTFPSCCSTRARLAVGENSAPGPYASVTKADVPIVGAAREVQQVGQGRLLNDCSARGAKDAVERKQIQVLAFRNWCVDRQVQHWRRTRSRVSPWFTRLVMNISCFKVPFAVCKPGATFRKS